MKGGEIILCDRKGRIDSNVDVSNAFDHSRIANFSDDVIGVLGWRGTGLLFILLIIGFSIFNVLFN